MSKEKTIVARLCRYLIRNWPGEKPACLRRRNRARSGTQIVQTDEQHFAVDTESVTRGSSAEKND